MPRYQEYGLLPEITGLHNFLKGVDFNRESRFGYAFHFCNFAEVRKVARQLQFLRFVATPNILGFSFFSAEILNLN